MIIALFAIALVVVIIGCVVASFFVRRHRETDAPEAGWIKTDEVFNDPSTNRVMRVWLDQGGERHYVTEANQKSI
ncbi:MAG: hypothetical protein F2903_02205 [Actinobacteria bacterium]|jgi:hypothetical protein|uniref:Unannotated protein n=1 Tax=freshwater metagenome TaxID=449393 RepID=A0A6J7Q8M6_9ZZZZ|nr:hypothetical protein [Actinomycetota bacterium]MSX09628.1 hypothetical protein [Actinomycetota bacterium]MSX68898.1 hypothetical protein [Actinomycetota bacterium]